MAPAVSEGVGALDRTVFELLDVQAEHRLQGRVRGDPVTQVHVATTDVGFAKALKKFSNLIVL